MATKPSLEAVLRWKRALPTTQCLQLSTTAPTPMFKPFRDPSRKSAPARPPRSRGETVKGVEAIQGIYRSSEVGQGKGEPMKGEKHLVEQTEAAEGRLQIPRRWNHGDVYAPRDLSPYEMKKWKGRNRQKKDVLDILGMNPIDNYRNFTLISEFITPHGRIRHSDDTALRPVNQRKMAKTIRRAIGLGIHPSVHFHPEILKQDRAKTPPLVVEARRYTSPTLPTKSPTTFSIT